MGVPIPSTRPLESLFAAQILALQTSLQATLQTAGATLNLSLLDFLA